jgi:nucleoside-diphosphate-sugar epimerase
MRICVTGAAGRVGRATVADLREHGHRVVEVDREPRASPLLVGEGPALGVDLTDFGETVGALAGCDAVVHLASIPAPGLRTPAATLNENSAINANVFLAAAQLGIGRVVWASSETTLGLPFGELPRYAPVDEDHFPHPTMTYALSKVVAELVAEHVAAWSGAIFAALRFSNVFLPDDYALVPAMQADPASRKWNLWGYVDARDAATACRLALEAPLDGAEAFIVAAADTLMDVPSAALLAEHFPGTELRRELGEFETLLSIDRARERLGFVPAHSWRDAAGQPD